MKSNLEILIECLTGFALVAVAGLFLFAAGYNSKSQDLIEQGEKDRMEMAVKGLQKQLARDQFGPKRGG